MCDWPSPTYMRLRLYQVPVVVGVTPSGCSFPVELVEQKVVPGVQVPGCWPVILEKGANCHEGRVL